MEKSSLKPFLRENLHILFVGLNPAKGSNDNRHYFSVRQSFWDQLFYSGLLTTRLDKSNADEKVFGSGACNHNNWNYGITDLVTEFAESDSKKIKPTYNDYSRLITVIKKYQPLTVVLLHSKVLKNVMKHLNLIIPTSNSGELGLLL